MAEIGNSVVLRGRRASIVCGWHPAAVLEVYTVRGSGTTWTLTGTVKWADAYACRAKGLIFTAPRDDKGMWAFGIDEFTIHEGRVRARLGPPLN